MQNYTGRCLAASFLLLITGVYVNTVWSGRAPEVSYNVNFKDIPLEIGDAVGERIAVEQRIFEYLGADAMDELMYVFPSGAAVRLSLVYGADWRVVHSPLSCYPQQGWTVVDDQEIEIEAPPDSPHPGPLYGRVLRVQRFDQKQLALYVFAHKGGTTGDWTAQGLAVQRTPRGSGGLLISTAASVRHDDYESALQNTLKILKKVYTPAVDFWY